MEFTTLLHTYADYDQWATDRLLEPLSELSDAMLDTPVKSSFPSLRSTLMHIRDAEHVWYCRLTGQPHRWPAEPDNGLDTLRKHMRILHEHVIGSDAEALGKVHSYTDLRGNVHEQQAWQILMHCFNHSSYHRGQVVSIMRLLELGPVPATDMIVFHRLRAKGEV